MYTFVADEGIVVRDSDQTVVSPGQDNLSPDFIAYIEWVMAGNTPAFIETQNVGGTG